MTDTLKKTHMRRKLNTIQASCPRTRKIAASTNCSTDTKLILKAIEAATEEIIAVILKDSNDSRFDTCVAFSDALETLIASQKQQRKLLETD